LPTLTQISELVKQEARRARFDAAGVAGVSDSPELDYFSEWIASGFAGEMKYLESRNEAGQLKRASLSSTAPWARSVIVCAANYNAPKPYSTQINDPHRAWISRYAWSRQDYHEVIMRRLRLVESKLREISAEPLQTRCYVDTGPLVERVYAKYAGVGWIGKNTCILNQKLGSWLFLGVILTSLELQPDVPAPNRCGSCTRCIEACPTDAFIAPYQLDANKCISYLTIEKRSPIAPELRQGMGQQVFGCDICQDVCPWNRKAPATSAQEFQPRPELFNPALEWLAQLDHEEFARVFRRSPVKRAKLSGLRRNSAIAMGNSGKISFIPTLRRLSEEADENVAEAAKWALKRLARDKSQDDDQP
jgi:epoxyqueuosine reductase